MALWTAIVLSPWKYTVDGVNTPCRTPEIVKEYELACKALSVQDHFKPDKNMQVTQIWCQDTMLADIEADPKYLVIEKHQLNDDRSEIEATPVFTCYDTDGKEDTKILDQTTCEKTFKEIVDDMGVTQVFYKWKYKTAIEYDHPDGLDKPLPIDKATDINTYLGTSLDISSKTKEETKEILIEEIKKYTASKILAGEELITEIAKEG